MGQCFSSTRAVACLPVNDIQLINDIIRNGYNFSDDRASAFLPVSLTEYYGLIHSRSPRFSIHGNDSAQVEDLDLMLQNEHGAMQVLLWYIDEWDVSRRLDDMVRAGFMRKQDECWTSVGRDQFTEGEMQYLYASRTQIV